MNQYETVFILTPVLSEDQMKEAVEKFKDILTSDGAEILYEENWGMRKTAFRRDERVLRYLTVKMEKYAAAYAAKRQSLKANKED